MQRVPRRVFQAALMGRAKWGLTDRTQLVAMVAARFAGARSLHDPVTLPARHRGALPRPGLGGAVARRTLADARRDRPGDPFEVVAARFPAEVAQWPKGPGREARRD